MILFLLLSLRLLPLLSLNWVFWGTFPRVPLQLPRLMTVGTSF